ncbi:PadR family transcriptional regulator [candidate division KSB1 bacterium]
MKTYITRNDEMILLSIFRLGENAYLVTLLDLLNETTDKKWTIGNLFVALDKLEEKGYITGKVSDPTNKRGGRAIKYYSVTEIGVSSLKAVRSVQDELWDGLYKTIFSK